MARVHNALTSRREPLSERQDTRLGSIAPRSLEGEHFIPAIGDGGGEFASHYMGGRGNDAYRDLSSHRPGLGQQPDYGQRIGFKYGRENDGSGAELDAFNMVRQFAETRFGRDVGGLPVEDVLRAAWDENKGDPTWERAIATTALGMGVPAPWEGGGGGGGYDDRIDHRGTDPSYGDTRRGRY